MQSNYDAKSKTVTVMFQYDPTGNYNASKSGKRLIVASTSGFQPIPGTDLALSLNATKMPKQG